MNTVREIRDAIISSNLTNDNLNELIQAITFARAHLRNQAKRTLRVGDNVKFNGKFGPTTGKLTKVAIKFATVQTATGNWRVPLNMLESV